MAEPTSTPTTRRVTRQEARELIALALGARWLVSHETKVGFVTLGTESEHGEYLDVLPDGYKALAADYLGRCPFSDASASKRLRDHLFSLGWWWEIVSISKGYLFYVWREEPDDDRFYDATHADEFTAIALVFLSAIYGERFELEGEDGATNS